MTEDSHRETISAIATPPGRGGIGIVRISGTMSLEIAGAVFRSTRKTFSGFKPYRLHHGWIVDAEDRTLDEIMISYMPGPGSFTGEDVVEIHCHGGPAVVQAILDIILDRGARLATPGEFTKRAFLNGKLDLTQAEAVAEMINAPVKEGLILAKTKLEGSLGEKVRNLRLSLEALRVQLSVAVDFPEEEIECLAPADFTKAISMAKKEIETLLQNYERAKVWREGVVVVLAGVVNAGKSSLLNAFLGKERAIVTPCPGTTRDYLEENILLGGLLVRLVDTAGLRKTEDDIEAIGLAKGKDRIQNADLVLLVFDCTQPIGEEERLLCEQLPRERIIAVSNKQDKIPAPDVEKPLSEAGIEIVPVSARTGEGLDKLGNAVRQRVVGGKSGPEDGQVVPNKRQEQALRSALQEIKALEEGLDSSVPYDLLGVQLEMVCTHLSEITGEITSQQVLDAIFSQFCIGK